MAVPRVSNETTKPTGRTLSDFPAYQAEYSRLNDDLTPKREELLQTIREAEAEERQASLTGAPSTSVTRDAELMLSGVAVASQTVPDLRQLRRDLQVVSAAILMQVQVLEKTRLAAAREIAGDYVADDRAKVAALLHTAHDMLVAFDDLEQHRAAFRTASGTSEFVVAPMQYIGLNNRGVNMLKADVPTFESFAKPYIEGN